MDHSDSDDGAPTEVTQEQARVETKNAAEKRKASVAVSNATRKRKRKRKRQAEENAAIEESPQEEVPEISPEVLAKVAEMKQQDEALKAERNKKVRIVISGKDSQGELFVPEPRQDNIRLACTQQGRIVYDQETAALFQPDENESAIAFAKEFLQGTSHNRVPFRPGVERSNRKGRFGALIT